MHEKCDNRNISCEAHTDGGAGITLEIGESKLLSTPILAAAFAVFAPTGTKK